MIKHIFFYCSLLLTIHLSYSQVGIGTTQPNSSSVLDVSSTDKGVLFPRMTTTQRDAIANPENGLVIYSLDEHCLQMNLGSVSNPDWSCIRKSSSALVVHDCDANGFEGVYVNGEALTPSNRFTVTLTNNSFNTSTINFSPGDLELSGVSGISVSSVSPTSATIPSGGSQVVEYALTGMPTNVGVLTGVWTKSGLNCIKVYNVSNGDAIFSLPQTVLILSVNDGASVPVVDIQGIIDNGANQLTVDIPYTNGVGAYDAFTGTYRQNALGTAEGGDENSFRLTYPSGTFSTSGVITATIEVDGDGSFNARKLPFNTQEVISVLDFKLNGNSKGNVSLDVMGGIPDRNFADANHRFIYLPVRTANGSIWLNNNLGANYSNMNHPEFKPTQQATAYNDYHAYGSLFQWGRYSDGHELMNYIDSTVGTPVNGTTTVQATSNIPGNSLFIVDNFFFPTDWITPQDNNLWNGESAVNNPCPQGYRVPAEVEMSSFIIAESAILPASAASSSLALTIPGYRFYTDGTMRFVGSFGYYWSTTVDGTNIRARRFDLSGTGTSPVTRMFGFNVRCIKD